MYSSLHQATMYVSKDFMFAKLSSNYYHGIIICHPLSQWTRQIVSQKTLFTIGILYQPPLLASQSAPLMNTCWPVLRTCNSNTFVLFFLSFLYSKKEFLQPKNHSSSNHVFKKIFSSSEKEKKISANYTLIFYIKFMYSEKATNFCEIFTLLLSYVVPVKTQK